MRGDRDFRQGGLISVLLSGRNRAFTCYNCATMSECPLRYLVHCAARDSNRVLAVGSLSGLQTCCRLSRQVLVISQTPPPSCDPRLQAGDLSSSLHRLLWCWAGLISPTTPDHFPSIKSSDIPKPSSLVSRNHGCRHRERPVQAGNIL